MNPVKNLNPGQFIQNHHFYQQEKSEEKAEGVARVFFIGKKAHEAEDAHLKTRYPIRRQLSTPNLLAARLEPTRQEKIAAKTGKIWDCIDCKHDKYGGESYFFKIKSDYDYENPLRIENYVKKMTEIFPAVELEPNQFEFLFFASQEQFEKFIPTENMRTLYQPILNVRCQLNKLGIDYEVNETGTYLKLPDLKALKARFERLKMNQPDLPSLDVVSSSGIASDMAFVEAYLNHDCLLSSGNEFIHDYTIHLIPTIAFMLTREEGKLIYHKEKFKLFKLIAKEYQKLVIAKKQLTGRVFGMDIKKRRQFKKNLIQIETSLGALVDISSTDSRPNDKRGVHKITENSLKHHVSTLTSPENKEGWLGYWNRRFGFENVLKPKKMKKTWKLISNLTA